VLLGAHVSSAGGIYQAIGANGPITASELAERTVAAGDPQHRIGRGGRVDELDLATVRPDANLLDNKSSATVKDCLP